VRESIRHRLRPDVRPLELVDGAGSSLPGDAGGQQGEPGPGRPGGQAEAGHEQGSGPLPALEDAGRRVPPSAARGHWLGEPEHPQDHRAVRVLGSSPTALVAALG